MMIGIRNHPQINPPKTTHPRDTIAQKTMLISVSILCEFLNAKYPANVPTESESSDSARKTGKTILSGMRVKKDCQVVSLAILW